jgi:hypothetical protein
MWGLENIPPPNKFSSTVKALRMSRLDHFALMDVSAQIQLGGAGVTSLRGPVPTGLVTAPAALVPPALPIPAGAAFVLPVDSRPGAGASNPANYLQCQSHMLLLSIYMRLFILASEVFREGANGEDRESFFVLSLEFVIGGVRTLEIIQEIARIVGNWSGGARWRVICSL